MATNGANQSKSTAKSPAKSPAKVTAGAESVAKGRDLSIVKDGSKFIDGTGVAFELAFAPVLGLAKRYGKTADDLEAIRKDLMLAETAMRRTVLRSDGTPDLSGTTDLWRSVLDADIVSIYEGAMGKQRSNQLRSAITSSRSRNGSNHANAAAYVVAKVNGLAAKTVQVERDGNKVTMKVADIVAQATPGTPIPDVVRKEMATVYSKQTDGNGKRAKGWEAVPVNFGGPSKQPKSTGGESESSKDSDWTNIRKDLREKVQSDEAARQVIVTLTVMGDTYLGKPDGKPGNADLIHERGDTAKFLRMVASYAKHLANGIADPDDASDAKEAIADFRQVI